MKGNKKKAKFFCENCGSEVPENARVCKKCGKFFISVRCPKCGATGTNDDFSHGCPKCGYAVNGTVSSRSAYSKPSASKKQKNDRLFFGKKNGANSDRNHGKINGETSLPLWVYIFTAGIFLVVLCVVYGCIKM